MVVAEQVGLEHFLLEVWPLVGGPCRWLQTKKEKAVVAPAEKKKKKEEQGRKGGTRTARRARRQ